PRTEVVPPAPHRYRRHPAHEVRTAIVLRPDRILRTGLIVRAIEVVKRRYGEQHSMRRGVQPREVRKVIALVLDIIQNVFPIGIDWRLVAIAAHRREQSQLVGRSLIKYDRAK